MLLVIKAKPNSRENRLFYENNQLVCKIASPPADGEANKCLIKYLSELFDVPKSQINLIKGTTSKIKTIEISDIYKPKVEAILKKEI